MTKKLTLLLLVVALVIGLAGNVNANYIHDNIDMLIGFPPGGGSDELATLINPPLAEILDVNITNQYIQGAAGAVMWTRLAFREPADGSVLGVTVSPMIETAYIVNEEIVYNISDFDPIANIVSDPGVIVVPRESEFDDINELIEFARENPGELNVAHSGVNGDEWFMALIVENAIDIDWQLVAFDGGGPAMTSTVAGDVDVYTTNVGFAYDQILEGDVKPLAILAEERVEQAPDVPTLKEVGYDVIATTSRGFAAPAGIPDEAKEILYAAVEEMSEREEFKERAASLGVPLNILIGDEYREYLERKEEDYTEIWAEFGE